VSKRAAKVRPTEPDERAALAAQQAAEEKAAEETLADQGVQVDPLGEGNDLVTPLYAPPVQLRPQDEIASDWQAVTRCILGLARFAFSRKNLDRAKRFAAAHLDRDPKYALKIGRGLARVTVRRQLATLDAIVEWVAVGADVVDEFATEALAEVKAAPLSNLTHIPKVENA